MQLLQNLIKSIDIFRYAPKIVWLKNLYKNGVVNLFAIIYNFCFLLMSQTLPHLYLRICMNIFILKYEWGISDERTNKDKFILISKVEY